METENQKNETIGEVFSRLKAAIVCDGCDTRHAVEYKDVNGARLALCDKCLTSDGEPNDQATDSN